jgi:hypothetical protein
MICFSPRYTHASTLGIYFSDTLAFVNKCQVWCPRNTALHSFRFERCHGDRFKAVYQCGKKNNIIGTQSKYYQTSCQMARWQKMEYLDRHNVQCPPGEVLTHFQLTGSGCYHWGMRFQYWCRKASISESREEDSTCQLLRGKHAEYMDRQRPECASDEVMTGFQLHSGGCAENHMRFRVRCVKVLMPWYMWGRQHKKKYQTKYRTWWGKYSKHKARYNNLAMPNSPSGNRYLEECACTCMLRMHVPLFVCVRARVLFCLRASV